MSQNEAQGKFPEENMALTHILVVSDLKQSRKFYLEILGASLYREYEGTSIVLQFLDNWLLLVTGAGPTADKPNTSFTPPTNPDSVDHAFTIRVNNCNRSYEVLKQRGANFITPPMRNGSETRCFFRDPDGHLFEISQTG